MKKISIIWLAIFLVIVTVDKGSAIVMYSHTYDPADVFLKAWDSNPSNDAMVWWGDIVPQGYDESKQSVTEAYLDLYLRGDYDCYPEKGELLVTTGDRLEYTLINPNVDQSIPIVAGLPWLQDGSTRFTVNAIVGDFWFEKAELRAYATDSSPTPTPEPATFLLVATGLAGLAGFRSRFRK